jgi:hypothetical protein
MRACNSAKVFSSSGKLGAAMPASRAPVPLAKSLTSCLAGEMEHVGEEPALSSASGSIFFASQWASAFLRMAARPLKVSNTVTELSNMFTFSI